MSVSNTRPWYVPDRACDEYRKTLSATSNRGGDLKMLKALKLLRSIIVNAGIILISLHSITTGGEPTIIGFVALAVLGGYNGLEFSDYLALVRAYSELQQDTDRDEQTDE